MSLGRKRFPILLSKCFPLFHVLIFFSDDMNLISMLLWLISTHQTAHGDFSQRLLKILRILTQPKRIFYSESAYRIHVFITKAKARLNTLPLLEFRILADLLQR